MAGPNLSYSSGGRVAASSATLASRSSCILASSQSCGRGSAKDTPPRLVAEVLTCCQAKHAPVQTSGIAAVVAPSPSWPSGPVSGGLRQRREVLTAVTVQGSTLSEPPPCTPDLVQSLRPGPLRAEALADLEELSTAPLVGVLAVSPGPQTEPLPSRQGFLGGLFDLGKGKAVGAKILDAKGASWTTSTGWPNSKHEKWRTSGNRVPKRLCRDGWPAWTSPRSWRGTFWTSKRGYGS